MRKYLTLIIALGALAALIVASVASATKPTVTEVGNLRLTVNGDFVPHTLPKHKLAPIKLTASGKIETLDGSHPPALKEFRVETDKSGTIDTKGYPVCKKSKIQATDTSHAEKACKTAIIGFGTTEFGILFEESKEILSTSKLLVFNGGTAGGVTTLYIHAYVTKPVPAAVVTTVKISKIHKGPFGLLSVGTIPKIAGGAGSVKSFSLTIDKKFTRHGKKVSVLSAMCPNGKLQAHATAVFSDGTRLSAGFIRPCTGKG